MSKKLSTAIAVFSDLILVNLAVALAVLIRFGGDIPWQNLRSYLLLSPFITFISPIIFYIFELYDRKACTSRPRIILNAFRSSLVIFIASILFAYAFRTTHLGTIPTPVFMLSFVLTIILIAGWRIIRWHLQVQLNGGNDTRRLAVLRTSDISQTLRSIILKDKQKGMQTIYFNINAALRPQNTQPENRDAKSEDNTSEQLRSIHSLISSKSVNNLSSLVSFIEKEKIEEVFIDSETMPKDMFTEFARDLAETGVKLTVVLDQYEILIGARMSNYDMPFPTIQMDWEVKAGWYLNFKHVVDIAVSLIGFIFLCLSYPIIALSIKLTSKGPVFYKQERVGRHGQRFMLWKFRTMVDDAEKETGPVWAKEDDDRITFVGKFLRKARLDEIPQFINVLKGDMSFIGPRPERPHFVNQFIEQIPFYARRLQVKPGITGWAQVHGSYDDNLDSVKLKLQHDLYYIENMSPLTDLIVFLKTIRTVLTGKGAR